MVAVVTQLGRRASAAFVDRQELASDGIVTAEPVLAGPKRPLHLARLSLEPGAVLHWRSPPQDHVVLVWRGVVTIDDRTLESGDVVTVEHGAMLRMVAESGAEVLVFERAPGAPPPERGGGTVHVVPAASLQWGQHDPATGSSHALFLASDCPTCDVWLHASDFPGNHQGSIHWHTTDEIIVVTAGTIVLGNVRAGPGAVLAVDRDTVYSFASGEDGVTFVNYRPRHSHYIRKDSDQPPLDERDYMLDALARHPKAGVALMEAAAS